MLLKTFKSSPLFSSLISVGHMLKKNKKKTLEHIELLYIAYSKNDHSLFILMSKYKRKKMSIPCHALSIFWPIPVAVGYA